MINKMLINVYKNTLMLKLRYEQKGVRRKRRDGKKACRKAGGAEERKGVDAGQSCGQPGDQRGLLSALRKRAEGTAAGHNRRGREAVRRKRGLSAGDRAVLTAETK